MYDPLTGDQEWVEIINNSEFEINLYNWKILDNLEDEIKGVEENILLNPGEFIVLGEDDISGILFQDDFPGLNNSGDNLFLLDPTNKIIDNVNYVDDWGGGDGFSLERITLFMDSNNPENWGGSVNPFGSTPNELNSLFIEEIFQNSTLEISPNPFSPDKDGH